MLLRTYRFIRWCSGLFHSEGFSFMNAETIQLSTLYSQWWGYIHVKSLIALDVFHSHTIKRKPSLPNQRLCTSIYSWITYIDWGLYEIASLIDLWLFSHSTTMPPQRDVCTQYQIRYSYGHSLNSEFVKCPEHTKKEDHKVSFWTMGVPRSQESRS